MKTIDIENYLKANYEEITWDNNLKVAVLDGEQIGKIEMKAVIAGIKENTPAPHDGLTASLVKDVVKQMSSKVNFQRESWMAGMDITDKGAVMDSSLNNTLLFDQHPDFKGKLYYNEVEHCEEYDGRPLDDIGLAVLKRDVELALGGNRGALNVKSAALAYCNTHHRNPLMDNLMKLRGTWDGEERLSGFFIKAYECDDTEYIRYATKVLFYAWINRILHPGCICDNMFVFEGEQGMGKSKLLPRMLRLIGGKATENMYFNSDRSNLEKFSSYQLCMSEELKDMKKSELAVIKDMITRTHDTFDRKYRSTATNARSCILVGNVNPEEKHFLKDLADYERRFIIFPCHAEGYPHGVRANGWWWEQNFPDEYLMQVWAEALYLVETEKDFRWMSLPENIACELKKIQAGYKAMLVDDVFLDKMEATLSLPFTEEGYDNYDRFVAAVEVAKNSPNNLHGQLNWISKGVWRRFVKDILREDRSLQYFEKAMENIGWKYTHTTEYVAGKRVNSYKYQRVISGNGEQLQLEV